MDYSSNIVCDAAVRGQVPTLIINGLQSLTTDLADMTHDCNFHQVLTSHVFVSSVDASLSGHMVRLHKAAPIDFMTLAAQWIIALEHAKKTVQLPTQRGVRTCLNSTLARQFPTNEQMFCYKRLPHTTFTDSLFAGTPTCSGNKCAQAFSTSFGWAKAHPMTRKGEAHETLSLLFHRDGVPPTMVFDSLKEHYKGDFKRKLCEADCHTRQTKPYSPWQQAAESCIHELKRGVSRKMIKTGSPRVLWDHCIELEALIYSLTSNNVYMTNGKVPETTMTGSTANISHICEFGWYDWVMFRDNVPTFPDVKLTLGQYLGPATNVGSALTTKILKSNGQTVCRSTLPHLNDEEIHCPIHQEMRRVFNETITHHIGPNATEGFSGRRLDP